jgi:hypothetical protein
LFLTAKDQNKIYNDIDSRFLSTTKQYFEVDIGLTTDPGLTSYFSLYFKAKLVRLKQQHPEWSDFKILYEASKDILHIGLDVIGLIPVFGEPADIINGAIYTLEGDGINAALSYAGAVPFVGWLSTTGKISIKVLNQTTQGLIGLVYDVGSDGIIKFGDRGILKHVIGSAGTGNHAHHIMPWKFGDSDLVQKAANSDFGFNMNQFENGIPLTQSNHLTGHDIYIDVIEGILIENFGPIQNMNPNEAGEFLNGLIQHLRNLIEANQDLNLGEIAQLINYP